jgi:hypothetical protein
MLVRVTRLHATIVPPLSWKTDGGESVQRWSKPTYAACAAAALPASCGRCPSMCLSLQVVAEVDAVLGDRAAPSLEDIKSLNYTRATLGESLRLYPQVRGVLRFFAPKDTLMRRVTGVAPQRRATASRCTSVFVVCCSGQSMLL